MRANLRRLCLVGLLQAEIDGAHGQAPGHRRRHRHNRDPRYCIHNSTIDGEHSSVVQVKANLAGTEWKLKESVVYAPANGFIPDVQLKEGYIAGLNQPVLSLVSTDDWWIYGLFEQSKLGLVETGDEVELIFRSYPGRVFRGKVDYIVRDASPPASRSTQHHPQTRA